jgi:AraC-like DNA-binding protein
VKGLRVGIVEDEMVIVEDMRDMLAALGHRVSFIAISSEEAKKELAFLYTDIVLLDIQLKGTESGIDLAKYIRHHYALPYIYVTSNADSKTVEEAKKTYPYGFIVKPFDEKDLFAGIEVAMMNFGREYGTPVVPVEDVDELPPSQHEAMLTRAFAFISQAIESGNDLGVEQLAEHLGMSARTLNRKLAASGMNANELIRNYRLTKSKPLLLKGFSVQEVAFRVGFESQQYFAQCFKEVYKVTPTDFLKQAS